jgi:hypothetical protein
MGGPRVVQHGDVPDEKNEAKAALGAGKVDLITLFGYLVVPWLGETAAK